MKCTEGAAGGRQPHGTKRLGCKSTNREERRQCFQYCVSVTLPVGLRLKGFDKKQLGGEEPVSDVEDAMGDGEEASQPLLPPVKSES